MTDSCNAMKSVEKMNINSIYSNAMLYEIVVYI